MGLPSVEILPPDPNDREPDGRFRPGHAQGGPGRPAGQGIGFTKTMRDALMQSFQEIGGKDYLIMLAFWKPDVYAGLMGRMMPIKVVGEDDGIPVIARVEHVFIDDAE
jgi:hypothetical protein